ncbi:MAG TPA: aminotransferase class V-fold PLP-dependent enzyme [Candidatus Limnocylindrales bacterium]|jgi:glutamate/tyrosine decarboxylase-like PLP-dependent enzyme
MSRDPLELDTETMRRMGYQVIDLLVGRIGRLASEPVLRVGSREELEARLGEPAPRTGRDFSTLLQRLDEDVLPFVGHFDHPRFFGYIPGAGTWPGALGDLISSAMNIDAGAWREASGPSQLELTVLDWFREWIGYPREAAGVLVSGGSAANLTAIACAREALIGPMSNRIVAYTSDQSHLSVARAMRHLGFRSEQIRVLPADETLRIRPADLVAAIDADIAAGRLPFLVAAVAGSTSTSAIDPLPELAQICHDRGIWLHVDAAYGGFAVLTDRGSRLLQGIELADSVTLDPHKWLAMPFEVGCLMVRTGGLLESAFELHPEYLTETIAGTGAVNFADRGLQLTRATRAIKVWLAIQTFGLDAFRDAIDRAVDQAQEAQRLIEADPRLELLTPASLGVLTFRRRGLTRMSDAEIDQANEALVASITAGAEVLLTSTNVAGRYAIRLCVLNHTTNDDDVGYALEQVASTPLAVPSTHPSLQSDARDSGAPAAGAVAGVPNPRDAGVLADWSGTSQIDAAGLRAIAAFREVTDDQAVRFLGTAREAAYRAGEMVTEQWAHARVFYLVLAGRLSVRVGEREVNVIAPGDHLGEIAAIDWGRDFSYGRTATVVATEPVRLLSFPASALRDLMADSPAVDREIRRIAHARLARR